MTAVEAAAPDRPWSERLLVEVPVRRWLPAGVAQ
ncbi:hypothetical protein FHR36_004460 [Kitasatospora paracochleata]|uniref:Uncharacterized protein n=1 Tax=Kitasatospora paracochleata TaxID=58354 RepID=A0ABT1J1I9_9ACTN|nr:hypothetical protein [Kitasatospora paracochleata]